MLYTDALGIREVIPGKFAFLAIYKENLAKLEAQLQGQRIALVSTTLHEQYIPFCRDFGPVNLGVVFRFYQVLKEQLALCEQDNCVLLYHFEPLFPLAENAAFLIGAFLVLYYDFTPQEAAFEVVTACHSLVLKPFRDASYQRQTHKLTILDCLLALKKAVQLGWFDVRTFDAEKYEALYDPHVGDVSQICPKFVAFKGPISADDPRHGKEEISCTPAEYVELFKRLGVTCVVRLNDSDTYDKKEFETAHIRHHDLYFDDCTIPSDKTVEAFLNICDRERFIAVHCRAGLGRTGTLIAIWLMKNLGFTSGEAIAWLRIVRPGCVIGPQQQYLVDCERWRWCGNRPLRPHSPHAQDAPPPGELQGARADSAAVASRHLAREVTAGMVRRGHQLAQMTRAHSDGDCTHCIDTPAAPVALEPSSTTCRRPLSRTQSGGAANLKTPRSTQRQPSPFSSDSDVDLRGDQAPARQDGPARVSRPLFPSRRTGSLPVNFKATPAPAETTVPTTTNSTKAAGCAGAAVRSTPRHNGESHTTALRADSDGRTTASAAAGGGTGRRRSCCDAPPMQQSAMPHLSMHHLLPTAAAEGLSPPATTTPRPPPVRNARRHSDSAQSFAPRPGGKLDAVAAAVACEAVLPPRRALSMQDEDDFAEHGQYLLPRMGPAAVAALRWRGGVRGKAPCGGCASESGDEAPLPAAGDAAAPPPRGTWSPRARSRAPRADISEEWAAAAS